MLCLEGGGAVPLDWVRAAKKSDLHINPWMKVVKLHGKTNDNIHHTDEHVQDVQLQRSRFLLLRTTDDLHRRKGGGQVMRVV